MTCYKSKSGLTVEINYRTVQESRENLFPVYLADYEDRCIPLSKEDIFWLRDHLDKIYKDLYQ